MKHFEAQQVFDLFAELYPRELKHVLAELRARLAEARLAELEERTEDPSEAQSFT